MSLKYQVDPEVNAIIRTVNGELSVSDVIKAHDASLSYSGFKKGMHVIWDLRNADVSKWNQDDFIKLANHIRNNIDKRGDEYKLILVASEDLGFGLSRMFEGYGCKLPLSIEVLRSMDAAYESINNEEQLSNFSEAV